MRIALLAIVLGGAALGAASGLAEAITGPDPPPGAWLPSPDSLGEMRPEPNACLWLHFKQAAPLQYWEPEPPEKTPVAGYITATPKATLPRVTKRTFRRARDAL